MQSDRCTRRQGDEVFIVKGDAHPFSGKRIDAPDHVKAAVSFAAEHATLENHARILTEKGVPDARDLLREMDELGLVVSDRELVLHCMAHKSSGNPAPLDSCAWITAERPMLLKESIESFVAYAEEHGRRLRISVFDDSTNEESRRANVAVSDSLRETRGIDAVYVGAREKLDFIRRLGAELGGGIGERGKGRTDACACDRILEFALADRYAQAVTCGANRNCFLLFGTGPSLMVDDDIFARPAVPRAAGRDSTALHVTSRINPLAAFPYPDRESLLDDVTGAKTDIFGLHERLLGKSIASVIAEQGFTGIETDSPGRPVLPFLSDPKNTVHFTIPGLYGDCATDSPAILLSLSGDARRAPVDDEAGYRASMASREVTRTTDSLIVASGTSFQAYNPGFSNATLTPPFFPVGRNAEAVLSTMVRLAPGNTATAYLPVSVFHDPHPRREFPRDALFDTRLRMSDYAILLLSDPAMRTELGTAGTDTDEGLQVLGGYFRSIGSEDPQDFRSLLARVRNAHLADTSRYYRNLLRTHPDSSGFWARDVDTLARCADAARDSGELILPRDLSFRGSERDGLDLFRRILFDYGVLIENWARIRDAARRIAEQNR